MKRRLFISYSRRDSTWVKNVVHDLRYICEYDAWYDSRLRGGVRWWTSICKEIKECDVFVYVGTETARKSLFCQAELDFAYKLNKPILPIVLFKHLEADESKSPEEIELITEKAEYAFAQMPSFISQQDQLFSVYEADDLTFILMKIGQSLAEIQVDIRCGNSYKINDIPLPDLPVPRTARKAASLTQEYFEQKDLQSTKVMVNHLINFNDDVYNEVSNEILEEIELEEERNEAFSDIKEKITNSIDLRLVRAMIMDFGNKYCSDPTLETLQTKESLEKKDELKSLLRGRESELAGKNIKTSHKFDDEDDD